MWNVQWRVADPNPRLKTKQGIHVQRAVEEVVARHKKKTNQSTPCGMSNEEWLIQTQDLRQSKASMYNVPWRGDDLTHKKKTNHNTHMCNVQWARLRQTQEMRSIKTPMCNVQWGGAALNPRKHTPQLSKVGGKEQRRPNTRNQESKKPHAAMCNSQTWHHMSQTQETRKQDRAMCKVM